MSIRTKLLIPLFLVGLMILSIIFTWERALNQIETYQQKSELASNYYQNVLATRIELDQYLLTDLNKNRNDFRETTKILLSETDHIGIEFKDSNPVVNEITEQVSKFISELDNYLEYDMAVDSTLNLISAYSDQLGRKTIQMNLNIQTLDSISINEKNYYKFKQLTTSSLEEIILLRSGLRELIVIRNDAELETVLNKISALKAVIEQFDSFSYSSEFDIENLNGLLDSITVTSQEFHNAFSKFELQSLLVSNIQEQIEDNTFDLALQANQRLNEAIEIQRTQSFIIYGFAILIFLIMTLQLVRVFTTPLKVIKGSIQKIGKGETIEDVSFQSKDEFGEILTTLKNMSYEIRIKENQLIHSNKKLEESNRELEAFAYSVSHDLRTPLRSISGFSQALLSSQHDRLDETGKDYLDRVAKAAQKMGMLIDDILKLSRISRTNLDREDLFINEIIQDIFDDLIDNYSYSYAKPVLVFRKKIHIYADPDLMKIAFQNLISNAIKFSSKSEHAKIVIDTHQKDGLNYITISDNGIGFNMKYVDKLFRPFQRLHSDSEYEGTGIGLATVKRIINKHSGDIFVESEMNKGTTFYIYTGGNK